MLISIITVVYNAVATLENTIKSVIEQNQEKFLEFIVIDGGSKDGTIDILKRYNDKIDFWLSEKDNGIYDALNKGVLKANGDWILFLGADDTLRDIRGVVEKLCNRNTIYYGDAYLTKSKKLYAGKFNRFKISHQNICHQAIFYPAKVFCLYNFDVRYSVHADYNMNLQLYADKRFKFEYINSTICEYSESGFSTKNHDNFYDIDRFLLLRQQYPLLINLYAKAKFIAVKFLKKNKR